MKDRFFDFILQINLFAVLLAKLQATMGLHIFSNLTATAESAFLKMEKPFHPCVIADWMPFCCVYTTVPTPRRFSMEQSTNPKWVSKRENGPSSRELLALEAELIDGTDPRQPEFSSRLLRYFPKGATIDRALIVLLKWTYLWCSVNILCIKNGFECVALMRCRHFWTAVAKCFEEEIRRGAKESEDPKDNANLWFYACRESFEITLKPDFNPFIEHWAVLRNQKYFEIHMLEAILQTHPVENAFGKNGEVRSKPVFVPENLNNVAERFALAKKLKFGSDNLKTLFAKNQKDIKVRFRSQNKSSPLPPLKKSAPETIFVSECTSLYEWIGSVLNSKNPSVNFLELIHIMSRLPLWNIVYNDTVSKDGTAAPRFRIMQGRQVVTVKVSTFIRLIRVLLRRGHFVGHPSLEKGGDTSGNVSQQPTSVILYWDDKSEEQYLQRVKVMESYSESQVKNLVSRYFRALEGSGCVHPTVTLH